MGNILEPLIPILGMLMVFGIPGLIIFWAIYTKHKERMRLIEKGLAPDEVKKYFASEDKIRSPYRGLKWAIILLSLGAGIVISNILYDKFNLSDGYTFGLVMLFLGIGFLIYYIVVKNKTEQFNSGEKK
mgnify:CR=1 FL=1